MTQAGKPCDCGRHENASLRKDSGAAPSRGQSWGCTLKVLICVDSNLFYSVIFNIHESTLVDHKEAVQKMRCLRFTDGVAGAFK